MRSRDPYVNLLTSATLKLFERGVRDPSASEIAAEAFKRQAPSDPLDQPPMLGGEVYDGVAKRLPKIRQELEDVEGKQAATVNARYYQLGFRDHPITPEQAPVVIPAPGNKAVGLRLVVNGENDPVYLAWQDANGKAGATRAGRALRQIDRAHQNGALDTPSTISTVRDIAALIDSGGNGSGIPPAQRIAQIEQRKLS